MAVQALRGSLIQLYVAAGVDPSQPVEVAKRIGFHKNLSWKVSRVMSATEPFSVFQHLPGESGLAIVADSFAAAGAPAAQVQAVRDAARELDRTIILHAGDRAHLELILDSMGLLNNDSQLEHSREMMFRGASGLWGVQAKVRLMTSVIVPQKDDPSRINIGMVGGMLGFRRLRPSASWRLFRYYFTDDQGVEVDHQTGFEGIDDSATGNGRLPGLLRRFCSPSMPEIEVTRAGSNIEYVLPGGPVGNLAAFDCFVGSMSRGNPVYRTPQDQYGSFASPIRLPVEQLVFDTIVHKDVPFPSELEVAVYGFPQGGPEDPSGQKEENRIPVSERCSELIGWPPALVTPHVPRYPELMEFLIQRMGAKLTDFRGYRLLMKYPPVSSTVVVRWRLPERP